MPGGPSFADDCRKLLEYRGGARYCRADLHTHTPASECSSFTLPPEAEALLPAKKPGKVGEWDALQAWLKGLADGSGALGTKAAEKALAARSWLMPPSVVDPVEVGEIARAYMAAVLGVYPDEEKDRTPDGRAQRNDLLMEAVEDLRRYLKSLIFPEEFVLRCYIEQLELVALTDHNHPGSIVLRVPTLGTWFEALERVNRVYLADVRDAASAGGRVRKAMLGCIRGARKLVAEGKVKVERPKSAEDRKKHEEARQKALAAKAERLAHTDERATHWAEASNPVRPLTLLPGTEITVSAVHLLTIFPPEWHVPGRIGAILRAIGIPEDHWGRAFIAASTSSVQDTVTLVDAAGGVAVPAHSNSSFKGLLRLFAKGLELRKVLEHPALLALETTGGNVVVGKGPAQTLQWIYASLDRPLGAKALCFTKGSDAHECRLEVDGTGEDLGMRYTNIKLDIRPNDTPGETFRSLRQALLSGQSRVVEFPVEAGCAYGEGKKVVSIPQKQREDLLCCEGMRPTILGLTVRGGYGDGLEVRFNPFLNCVVGSGGKSAVVRFAGYAFGAIPLMKGSHDWFLPEQVRVFWQEGGRIYCVERTGKCEKPEDAVAAVYALNASNASWTEVPEMKDGLARLVEVWPPRAVQEGDAQLSRFEPDVVEQLVAQLDVRDVQHARPLLVNQPRDIFGLAPLFDKVLAHPRLKARQIIWSTGSANVPTALDAEKIIVTREKGKGHKMEVVCAGDLHEDEIREQFLTHLEGGWQAFSRRAALYSG